MAEAAYDAITSLQKKFIQIDSNQFPWHEFVPPYGHLISELHYHGRDRLVDALRKGREKFRPTLCGAPLQHLLGTSKRYYPVPWTKLVYYTRLGGYVADIHFSRLQKAASYRKGSQPESPDFKRVDDYCNSHP